MQADKIARGDKIARKNFCNAYLELDKEKNNKQKNLEKKKNRLMKFSIGLCRQCYCDCVVS